MMDDQQIIALLEKYRSGTLTDEEKGILESWYNRKALDSGQEISDHDLDKNLALISKGLPLRQPPTVHRIWPRIAAAAAVLFCVFAGGYFARHQSSTPQTAQQQPIDIAPGGNRAILYAEGKKYVLDSLRNGVITTQENVAINKNAAGQLTYSSVSNAAAAEEVTYDTLIIPRGGQHEIRFADGSSVVLNADSKLRYPERFVGNQRKVELISGEAQFHIKHNAAMPFYVLVKGQTIKDIGTTFNINAYDDETVIRTTLIEGSVEVSRSGLTRALQPGEQAITGAGRNIDIQPADTNEVVAWTKGQFYFAKTNLKELMRQLGRWYNIGVVYEGNVPDDAFDGQVSRNESLTQMLKILQLGDIHFRIEPGDGKIAGRLIITP
jgi:transmembrane sensor